MQLLDGGQQTASESLTSAENMLDLVPERRRGRLYKPGWTVHWKEGVDWVNLDGLDDSVAVDLNLMKNLGVQKFTVWRKPTIVLPKSNNFFYTKIEILPNTSTETKRHNGLIMHK